MQKLRKQLLSFGIGQKKAAGNDTGKNETAASQNPQAEESSDEGVSSIQEPLLNGLKAGRSDISEWVSNNTGSESHLEARFNAEELSKASDFYIALEGELNWRELLKDIEAGDNFRLIDRGSLESRVRGVKLSYSRFPPRYLPLENSNTVYFKVMKDESARIWRYILDDKTMIIDCAHSLLDKFTAKLFVLTENEEN